MDLYAVINGDIVGSTKLTQRKREQYLLQLKGVFETLKKKRKMWGLISGFEMYRGDSFQCALNQPEKALRLALLLRSFSRMMTYVQSGKRKAMPPSTPEITDLRIAVGVGKISKLTKKLMESDGDAFHRSGRLIDSMKKRNINLAIDTPWDKINREFTVSWWLADSIISKWSPYQAQVVYYTLMGHNQGEMAAIIKASPSAISQRLKTASWSAIENMLNYFESSPFEKLK